MPNRERLKCFLIKILPRIYQKFFAAQIHSLCGKSITQCVYNVYYKDCSEKSIPRNTVKVNTQTSIQHMQVTVILYMVMNYTVQVTGIHFCACVSVLNQRPIRFNGNLHQSLYGPDLSHIDLLVRSMQKKVTYSTQTPLRIYIGRQDLV